MEFEEKQQRNQILMNKNQCLLLALHCGLKVQIWHIYLQFRGTKMWHLFSLLYFLLILSLSSQKHSYFSSPLGLYVSDRNSSTIFKRQSSENKLVGILFTNKYCTQCYFYQEQLTQIISIAQKTEKVRIYRSELTQNQGLQQQFHIKRFPMLHFVLPKQNSFKLYHSSGIVTKNNTLSLIKQLKYYLNQNVELDNTDQLYINQQQLPYIDKQQIFALYGLNHIYEQLPLQRVLNTSQFRSQLETKEIEFYEISTCLVYHLSANRCYQPKNMEQFGSLLSLILFEKVNEFIQPVYKHYQQLQSRAHVFVAVLDSIIMREKSIQYMEMLNEMLHRPQLKGKIVIFWMEAQINRQKLEHLGFEKNASPPLFAYFDLSSRNKQVLTHKEKGLQQKEIYSFIKNIIKVDEQYEMKRWNLQLLGQSLNRLGLQKKITVVNSVKQIQQSNIFLLSLPEAQYEDLSKEDIFYESILSYNYFVRRIQRFNAGRTTKKYITFQKVSCQNHIAHGLYLFDSHKWSKISRETIIKPQEIPHQTHQYLHSLFELPQYYWINEDDYLQYLLHQNKQNSLPQFIYVQV